jgi:hypothetical protein
MFLWLDGIARPLRFSAAATVVAGALESTLIGWPLTAESAAPPGAVPLIAISRRRSGFALTWPEGGTRVETGVASAVATLVVEIVDAFATCNRGLVSLHAAAADLGSGVVLFPAPHRTGKSTLMARLSAAGKRVYADDLIALDLATGEAYSTGALTRLRLPVPPDNTVLSDFVAASSCLEDGRCCYVRPPDSILARHGLRAPVAAIVLLERQTSGEPRLTRVDPEQALLAMLMQDARSHFDAARDFDAYRRALGGIPSFRLVFSGLDEAFECLDKAFSSGPPRIGAAARTRFARSRKDLPADFIAVPQTTGGYRRSAGVRMEQVGADGFLIDTAENRVFHLNPLGRALWILLEHPVDRNAALEMFGVAFPDIGRDVLSADLDRMLHNLVQAALIDRVT